MRSRMLAYRFPLEEIGTEGFRCVQWRQASRQGQVGNEAAVVEVNSRMSCHVIYLPSFLLLVRPCQGDF